MKSTMRVLHVRDNGSSETVYVCHKASKSNGVVWIHKSDNQASEIRDGEIMVLGDDGKCVHRWDLDR